MNCLYIFSFRLFILQKGTAIQHIPVGESSEFLELFNIFT